MPTSDPANIWPALRAAGCLRPERVLDVGIGFGKMGALLREYLEVAQGRYDRKGWKVRIDGIEPFASYKNPLWDACYDQVFTGTLQEVLPSLPRYDLATFMDVIEHLPKEEGRAALGGLLDKARFVLVSTPLYFDAQGAAFGNELERHVSHWTERDFAAFHPVFHHTPTCLLAVLSREPFDKGLVRFPSPRRERYAAWRAGAASRGRAWAERALPAPAVAVLQRLWRAILP